jgi:hypothetical protein
VCCCWTLEYIFPGRVVGFKQTEKEKKKPWQRGRQQFEPGAKGRRRRKKKKQEKIKTRKSGKRVGARASTGNYRRRLGTAANSWTVGHGVGDGACCALAGDQQQRRATDPD